MTERTRNAVGMWTAMVLLSIGLTLFVAWHLIPGGRSTLQFIVSAWTQGTEEGHE